MGLSSTYFRVFKHYDVFPELYGSCGGLYMVEKLRPLPSAPLFQVLKDLVKYQIIFKIFNSCYIIMSQNETLCSAGPFVPLLGREGEGGPGHAGPPGGARHYVPHSPPPL